MNSRRTFLHALACAAGVALLPGCAKGVEDPQKTKRFTAFLQGILAGKVVDDNLTVDVKSALTPGKIEEVRQVYAPLGALQNLRYLGEDQAGGVVRYHYVATFAQGTKPMFFALDAGGRLAGFFNE